MDEGSSKVTDSLGDIRLRYGSGTAEVAMPYPNLLKWRTGFVGNNGITELSKSAQVQTGNAVACASYR
jgi:hypothetical protein